MASGGRPGSRVTGSQTSSTLRANAARPKPRDLLVAIRSFTTEGVILMTRRSASGFCIGLVFGAALIGCSRSDQTSLRPTRAHRNSHLAANEVTSPSAPDYARLSDAELDSRIGPQVGQFCSTCHPVPDAAEAPREEWRHEVEFAYGFHKKSARRDQPAPDIEGVIAYFERKALPYDEFVAPALGDSDPGRLKFTRQEIRFGDSRGAPAVAGLTWLAPTHDRPGALLVCDMRFGGLYSIQPKGALETIVEPGSKTLSNACHVEPCDLDGDGSLDLVVADLGHFFPTDELFGRVVWLRGELGGGRYKPIEAASGLGRVADAQPGDFDGDGDDDLIVAEFGLYEAGKILLLENRLGDAQEQRFVPRELDPRHGAVCVRVTDLNQDGKLDFIALISQEHEVVEAFLNQGGGAFERQRVYAAPNPSWGSSGLQLVDLDADGDLDLLYSNGDSFDRGYLKPYHAVRWLENQGQFPWAEHHLMNMPGCHCALAGDMDLDGDLDVVAIALQPAEVLDRFGKEHFDSICWLEQTARGEFHRRTLELGECNHMALSLADFDADGDLDIAIGDFHSDSSGNSAESAPLTILWNQVKSSPETKASNE